MGVTEERPSGELESAFDLVRRGDIVRAQQLMQIPPGAMNPEAFVGALSALEDGLQQLQHGATSAAAKSLAGAFPLVQMSKDAGLKSLVMVLRSFADGISLLLHGDFHRADELLGQCAKAAKQIAFFLPVLGMLPDRATAAQSVARARIAFNRGDISRAEKLLGDAAGTHETILARLDSTEPGNAALVAEVYTSQVEAAVVFTMLDAYVLDFDSMDRRLRESRTSFEELDRVREQLAQGPVKAVIEVIVVTYGVLETFAEVGRSALFQRNPLVGAQIQRLKDADQALFNARQKANKAGDRGQPLMYVLDQTRRLLRGLLAAGRATKRDFGRLAGFIALGTLVVELAIVHWTFSPSGSWAVISFFLEIVVALIVGYGYGALKFLPLMSLCTQALRSTSERNE